MGSVGSVGDLVKISSGIVASHVRGLLLFGSHLRFPLWRAGFVPLHILFPLCTSPSCRGAYEFFRGSGGILLFSCSFSSCAI